MQLTAGSGPTPLNLQLLSSCLQQASQLLECPVCLESVSPPAWQCCHGHLLCSGCRSRSDRCPMCRVPLGPRGRSLLADKLHALLSQTHRRYSDQRSGARAGAVTGGQEQSAVHADPPPTPAAIEPPTESATPTGPSTPAGTAITPAISATSSTTSTSSTPSDADATIATPTTPPVPEINEPRAHVLTRGLRLTASSEDVTEGAGATLLAVPRALTGSRARSQSAGHIVGLVGPSDKPADQQNSDADLTLVHCPYGSTCRATCPPAEVFNHLREVSVKGSE